VFDFRSELNNKNIKKFQDETTEHMKNVYFVLDQMTNDNSDFKTADGSHIINITPDKLWFRNNIGLVFSTGCIFDENDQNMMNSLMTIFHNDHRTGFLDNIYKIYSYQEPLIQKLEDKMAILNGNYHICLFTLVFKSADLDESPEGQYFKHGLINKYTDWNEIYAYIQESLGKYGLLAELIVDPLRPQEIPDEPYLKPKEVFLKYDYVTDPHEENSIMWMKHVETKEEMEKIFPKRVRDMKYQRPNIGFNEHRSRLIKHPSLATRIREDGPSGDSVVDNHTGIELRFDERKPPPSVKHDAFQLYDLPAGFEELDDDNLKNNQVQMNSVARTFIPIFKQTDIRGSKSRTVLPSSASLSTIQNKFGTK